MEKESRIRPAGDQALLVEFGTEICPGMNRQVHEFVRRASAHRISGIGEMVSSYCSVLVYFDPLHLSFSQTASWVKEFLNPKALETNSPSRVKKIPVLYGGEFGPDISFVASHNQITVEEVIRLHTCKTYLVYVVGIFSRICRHGKRFPENSVAASGKSKNKSPCRDSRDWRPANRHLCSGVPGRLAVDRANTPGPIRPA